MKNEICALLALSPRELDEFLPPALRDALHEALPGLCQIDPTAMSVEDWARCLVRHRPQILITGWKALPLPADLPVGDGGLRYLCHLAGSVRHLVVPAQLAGGLRVSNWGDSVSRVMAECALFLSIAALRRASHWALAMHGEGAWKTPETQFFSLFERRVGLHGFGAIARELVRLMAPFGVRCETWSPRVPDEVLAQHGVARAASLQALFSDNDVIIELAPLTPATTGMVTEDLLRRIRPGGVFVNIGRGAVVDEAALIRIAQEGQVQIALDVFHSEPLPADSPLRGLHNVTLLPHLSGPTTDRRQDAGAFAIANIRRYLAGEALQAEITPEVLARST